MPSNEAFRRTVLDLYRQHPRERFHYVSLITTGEGHAPAFVAWSQEALESFMGPAVTKQELLEQRFEYAESPFYCFGESHFDEVRDLFATRPEPSVDDESQWNDEVELRVRAMESAMRELDAERLFGTGRAREAIVVNVECMPPDASNIDRAKRLNPPAALVQWLGHALGSLGDG